MKDLEENLAINDEDILQWCQDPHRQRIGPEHCTTKLIKVDDRFVVKFGHVHPEEFTNQKEAYKLLDQRIVRIPRPYRFFTHDTKGYLLMEYIDGEERATIENEADIRSISKVLEYLSTFQGTRPGPIAGGASRGLIWSEYEDMTFRDLDHLEMYLNSRLVRCPDTFDLQETQLVLCHLDIAPRNILWPQDGPLCVLDWASAGWYPRFFEYCALDLNSGERGKDIRFTQRLMEAMSPLTDAEKHQVILLETFQYNNIRYCFTSEPTPGFGDVSTSSPSPMPPLTPSQISKIKKLLKPPKRKRRRSPHGTVVRNTESKVDLVKDMRSSS